MPGNAVWLNTLQTHRHKTSRAPVTRVLTPQALEPCIIFATAGPYIKAFLCPIFLVSNWQRFRVLVGVKQGQLSGAEKCGDIWEYAEMCRNMRK